MHQPTTRRTFLRGLGVTMALPWDDWGQANTDTVPSSWLPAYLSSKYSVVWQESWGYVAGFNRRYRFEVHSDTTVAALMAGLTDTRFTRAG